MIDHRILDYGLQVLILETTALHICQNLPSSYVDVGAGNSLGVKLTPTVVGPQNWSLNGSVEGRKVTVQAFMDGIINAEGQVSFWALVDDNGSRLLAAFALSAPKNVVVGNTFSLEAIEIAIPFVPETSSP